MAAVQHARDHAPFLLPLLRELELRRQGTADLHRLMKLEQRRQTFLDKLGIGAWPVVDLEKQIVTLRGELLTLNLELQELLT